MKTRRVAAIAKKDLKSFVREPATLFLLLIFPLLITMAFGIAFGGMNTGGETNITIGIVNMDMNSSNPEWSEWFVGNMTQHSGTSVIIYDSNETGQADLLDGGMHALVIIPEAFGQSIESFWNSPFNATNWNNVTLELYLDSGSMVAGGAVPPIIQQVLFTTIYGEQTGTMQIPIEIGSPSMVYVSYLSQWDYMAPGIFAFAAIFMIMTVAQSLTVERDGGILSRMATTPVTASEFILGRTLAYMVVAMAQVSLVFAGSFAIGYRPNTGLSGLAFAFLIVILFALASVGMGLITAVVSKSADMATGIAFIFIMPQMLFGTFMPLGGLSETLGSFMPSNYVTHALTTLFLRGAPISTLSIWIDVIVIAFVGILMLAIGTVLFARQNSRH